MSPAVKLTGPWELEMTMDQSYDRARDRCQALEIQNQELRDLLDMFERFTERARLVVTLAQEEARDNGYDSIGVQHIFAGLLKEEHGLAAQVLKTFDITYENFVFPERTIIQPTGQEKVNGQIPFTPNAKKCLELALREALGLGHNFIGTEHILLAWLKGSDGSFSMHNKILNEYNVSPEEIKNEVIRMLSGPGVRESKQHKTEEEPLKQDGQKEPEQKDKKAQATITYGDLTLKIEGPISGVVKQLIKSLSD